MGLKLVLDGSKVWLGLSRGVSLALTNLFLRAGLAQYARVGGSGKIWLSCVLCLMSPQCFRTACLILGISSLNFVVNMSLGVCSFVLLSYRFSVLWLNFMSCICCSMLCCLYPLCFNLCISLVVIFLKFVSFEFVLRYLLVSMASFAAGGVV